MTTWKTSSLPTKKLSQQPAAACKETNGDYKYDAITSSSSSSFDFGLFDSQPQQSQQSHHQAAAGSKPRGVYAIYKQATEAFRDGLAKQLPKGFSLVTIHDYKRGVDMIYEQSIHAMEHQRLEQQQQQLPRRPPAKKKQQRPKRRNPTCMVGVNMDAATVFQSLDTSIRLRRAQARKYGDHDRGHVYIIQVLEYCRDVLRLSQAMMTREDVPPSWFNQRQTRRPWALPQDEENLPPSATVVDVWTLCDHHDTLLRSKQLLEHKTPQLAPEQHPALPSLPPLGTDDAGSEDLIHANDRFQCMAFLETMDQLMGVIRKQFDNLKKRICSSTTKDNNEGVVVEPPTLHRLMECSIATNLCMECIKTTWAELTLEHAHIRSFYDVLAIVFILPKLHRVSGSQKFEDVLSFSNERFPHLLTHFVGDVIEGCFAVDGLDTSNAIKAYGSKLCLEQGGWEKQLLLDEAEQLAWYISELVMERESHKIRQSFLSGYKFIGSGSCILNTQKVLQQVFSFIDGDKQLLEALPKAAANTFGSVWDENTNPARQIRGDLDHFLAGEILPELLAACQEEYSLPLEANPGVREIVPLLFNLKMYTRDRFGSPVPIDITFGIHAILLSVIALQGNNHVQIIGVKARSAFAGYMDTLRESGQAFVDCEEPVFTVFDALKQVFEPDRPSISPTSSMTTYWNPFLGGAFGAYSIYMGVGCQARYLREHLRPVLHLYNALRCRKLIDTIAFLDYLDHMFLGVGAIWIAEKSSRQGDFTKTFLLGTGLAIRDISIIMDYTKAEYGIRTNRYRYANDRLEQFVFNPKNVEILRSCDFAQGHAALFWKDYSKVTLDPAAAAAAAAADYPDAESEDVSDCEDYINMACQALRNDVELFGGSFVDLIGIAVVLKDFCQQLDILVPADDPYYIDVFGELDFAPDTQLDYAPRIARLMTEYFGKVQRNDYTFSSGM